MKAIVNWQDKICFAGETESGHQILMDGATEFGGENRGARPMEMVLLGLGGCSSIDVILILQKAKQSIEDCKVEISAERSESIPKVFTKIHLHFTVIGSQLNEQRVKRAIDLSADKYCSVSLMLEKSVQMSHSFEIIAPNE